MLAFTYRVVKENQRREYLDLLDYTVNAITLGIQADARRQVKIFCQRPKANLCSFPCGTCLFFPRE